MKYLTVWLICNVNVNAFILRDDNKIIYFQEKKIKFPEKLTKILNNEEMWINEDRLKLSEKQRRKF